MSEKKRFSIHVADSGKEPDTRFKALMDVSPDPIVIYDSKGNTTYINSAFENTYGFTPEEVIGKKIQFVPEDEADKTLDAWQRTIKGEKLYLETRRYTKTGECLDIQMSTAIVKDARGNHLESIVIHRDITPLKNAEQEKETLIVELKEALASLKTLSGLLPICSKCKKIRDDKGYWNTLELYIEQHSNAMFTHSICQDCETKLYGDQDWYKALKRKEK